MIVPRTRLLFWFAAVVLPFATLGAVSAPAFAVSALLIGSFLAALLLDAMLAHGKLEGIVVEFPPVVRMTQNRAGSIELTVRNDRQKAERVRFGLAFPREIHSPNGDMTALLPAQSRYSRFVWPCTPLKRGNYPLHTCHLEGTSPLGFWAVRSSVPAHTELRVYPNLGKDRKHLAALFLNRGHFGLHTQRQVGKGREFEKLREYIPGDSSEDIHWKATAKRGRPVTKVFQIERTQEVYVIIDASRLSARTFNSSEFRVSSFESTGANPEPETQNSELDSTLLERYVTAALVLGLAAEKQGDLYGLLTFSDRVLGFVRARNGKAHYGTCRDALYRLQPQIVNPDFDEVCTFLRLRLRRRALLIFLTNLDDPILAESFTRNVELISRQHLVLFNMLKSNRAAPLFADAAVRSTDDVYRKLGGHVLWHNLRELEKVLQRRGVAFAQLDNEQLAAQLVTQYLSVKRRQLL